MERNGSWWGLGVGVLELRFREWEREQEIVSMSLGRRG